MTETRIVKLPDGRTLSYGIYGVNSPTASLTVFYFHGFPSSHHEALTLDDLAKARDIRIVAPDRPGMNQSTFQLGRTIVDWPKDVLALADHEDIRADTFAVIGTSGGAPYALACCAALPKDRLKCTAIISGLYPASLGTEGMMALSKMMLWLAPWSTALVEGILDWTLGHRVSHTTDPHKLEEILGSGMEGRPEQDKQAWEDNERGLRQMLVATAQHAFPDGSAHGAAWEARLNGSPWGFQLEDLDMDEGKLILWHGGKDINSPLGMTEKAHALLAGSELRVDPNEAHMSLFLHKLPEVLDTLKERSG
jgi:pimeloyl-ACP methyl ester carboxylesterase